MRYYYLNGDQRVGPLGLAEFLDLRDAGFVRPTTLVSQGKGNYRQLALIDELQGPAEEVIEEERQESPFYGFFLLFEALHSQFCATGQVLVPSDQ